MIRCGVVLLLLAGVLLAQPKGQLSGFVHDSSSAAVGDAVISVINLDTGVRRSAKTTEKGFYAVSSLTPGQYKITVRKPGFQTVARTGVPLHALDSGRIDFTLEIGSLHEELTVEGTPALMNTSDASQGMQVNRRPADSLPLNGRGLQALIDLAPGVLTTPATAGEAGQFSANGQRPATNYFTVDGVSANNGISGSGLPGQFSGGALPAMTAIGSLHNLLSLGELDELRVQTSTYAPEYGRLPGAQVAVSTRSGSNEFHGELSTSLRHERLSARDWFARPGNSTPFSQRLTDIAGSIGGPIRRNQTFFLVSGEHVRLRQSAAYRIPVPSLASRAGAHPSVRDIINGFPLPDGGELGPDGGDLGQGAALHTAQFVMPSRVTTTSARVDHALGGSGSLFVRYNRTPSTNRFGYFQSNEADFRSQTITVGLVSALSPRVTNDARLGVSNTSVASRWLPGTASIDLRSILPSPGEGQKLYGIGIRGVGQVLTGDPGESRQGQWNLTNTLAYTSGRHNLRLGVDYQRLTPEREQPIASVVLLFDSVEQLAEGKFPFYTYAQTGGGASLLETFSAFVQDTWHLTPRLNVTYGMRWELTPSPSYRLPAGPRTNVDYTAFPTPPPTTAPLPESVSPNPVWNTRFTQFAPRVGLAYRLDEGGTRVLRAGGGLFYDLGFSSAVDLVNGGPYNRWRSLVGITTVAAESMQYGFADNLRLPYSMQWNVTLEQSLGRDSVASIGYVGSAGRRLLRRESRVNTREDSPSTQLVLATNNGEASYHSLQAHYRSRSVGGLQGTVSYTWAHAIDNGSWDSATWLLFPGSGSEQDRGSANFDVRHSFQAALAYDLGRSRLPFARGWLVSGTLRARTGFPLDVVTSEHPFGLGFDNDQRPDLVPGQPVWISDPNAPGGRVLNPAAFRVPTNGLQGNLGRNALRGNSLAQLDLALEREFSLTERAKLELRVEGYNVTNSPNFGDPVRVLSSPLFGTSTSMTNLMLGAGRPNSGLSPAFQSGGPRLLQGGFTIRF